MTRTVPVNEPATEAGRQLVEDEPRVVTGEHDMRTRVLAIEAEERRRTVAAVKRHTPTLYADDPHGSQIHCACGIAFHMAGWWAHVTVEVAELVR